MSTYSLRCCNSKCRHRRVSTTHPDDYKRVPKCPSCGQRKGWRIEQRYYNKRNKCQCSGPLGRDGMTFPHNTTHPLCDLNPNGLRNQALRYCREDELPLELQGRVLKDSSDVPF